MGIYQSGVSIAERWIDGVVRVNERIMYVKLVSTGPSMVVWDLVQRTLKARGF